MSLECLFVPKPFDDNSQMSLDDTSQMLCLLMVFPSEIFRYVLIP